MLRFTAAGVRLVITDGACPWTPAAAATAQFVSSVLTWQSAQLALQMTATWPSSIRPILEVQLAVIPWNGGNEESRQTATGRAEGAEAEEAVSGGGEGESGQAAGKGIEEAVEGVAAAAGSVVANGAAEGSAVADGAAAEVNLRIPSWAAAAVTSSSGSTPHCTATLNGGRLPCPKPATTRSIPPLVCVLLPPPLPFFPVF
ncbi:unnamed protein product, partial [Closterium sp. Naga37s-1]